MFPTLANQDGELRIRQLKTAKAKVEGSDKILKLLDWTRIATTLYPQPGREAKHFTDEITQLTRTTQRKENRARRLTLGEGLNDLPVDIARLAPYKAQVNLCRKTLVFLNETVPGADLVDVSTADSFIDQGRSVISLPLTVSKTLGFLTDFPSHPEVPGDQELLGHQELEAEDLEESDSWPLMYGIALTGV
ncbi:hypothetical protein MMC27_001700 [Xylographa pallens]|nr:hypothetical protein [Xylographa pallens]